MNDKDSITAAGAAPSNAKAKGKGKAAAPGGASTSQKKQPKQQKQQGQHKGRKDAAGADGPPTVPNKELLQRMNFLHQAAVLLACAVHNPKHLAGQLKGEREREDTSNCQRQDDRKGPAGDGPGRRNKRRRLEESPMGLIPTQVEEPAGGAVVPDEAIGPTNEESGDAMPVDRSKDSDNAPVKNGKSAPTLKQKKRSAKKASGATDKTERRRQQFPSVATAKDISKAEAGGRLVVGRVLPITRVQRPDAPLPNPHKVREAVKEHMKLSLPRILSSCTSSEKKQLEKGFEAFVESRGGGVGGEGGDSVDRLLELAQKVIVNDKRLTRTASGDAWTLQDYSTTQKNPTLGSHYVKDLRAIARKSVLRIDPTIKRTLCRNCNTVLVPGLTSSIRILPSGPHVHVQRTKCLQCGVTRTIPCPPLLPFAPGTLPEARDAPTQVSGDMSVDVSEDAPAVAATSASTPTLMSDTTSETISKSSSSSGAAGQRVGDPNGRKPRSIVPGRKKQYRNRGFCDKKEHAVWRGNDKISSRSS